MTTDQITHAVIYGTCQHCARLRPLQSDGLMAIHYLRYHVADRDRKRWLTRRKRCPGARRLPREDMR